MNYLSKSTTVILLLIILAIAVFFRLYKLNEIPPALYPDVAVNGVNASQALSTGDFKVFYTDNNGREGLFMNLIALSFFIFGQSVWAIKIVAAIFGILTVLGTYFLTKELFLYINLKSEIRNPKQIPRPRLGSAEGGQNPNDLNSKTFENLEINNSNLFRISNLEFKISHSDIIALLSTFFVAVSFWHVNFSRLGFRAIAVPFFLVWGLYFLIKATQIHQPTNGSHPNNLNFYNKLLTIGCWLVAGLLFGLGFHTYIAFRIAPLILVPIFIIEMARYWPRLRLGRWFIFAGAAALAAAPLAYYYIQNPADFMGRAGQVSILASGNPIKTLVISTIKTLGQFLVWGDPNWRHNISGSPEIFWPLIPLFLIGIIYSIKQILKKQKYCRDHLSLITTHWTLLFAWGAMLLPGIATNEGLPHALRTIGAIPATYIFIGLGAFLILLEFKKRSANWRTKIFNFKLSFYILLFAFLISLTGIEYYRYFIYWGQSQQVKNSFAQDLYNEGMYLKTLPASVKKIVVINESSPDFCTDGLAISAHTIKFLAPADTEFTYPGCQRFKNLLDRPTNGETVFVPMQRDSGLIQKLKSSFPNGRIENFQDFTAFKIN